MRTITPSEEPRENQWMMTPLYKQDARGSQAVWQIGFDGVDHLIMQYGKVGGIIRKVTTEVVPKVNRTMQQQALLEARHRYEEKFRKDGYRPEGEEGPKDYKPMLANQWIPGKTKLAFPLWAQPKFDGIRMLCHLDGDKVVTRSRNNKPFFFLDHITDKIKIFLGYLPSGTVIDGELYSERPGMNFNKITSIAKRTKEPHPETSTIDYYIFDLILPHNPSYDQRYEILLSAYDAYNEAGHLEMRDEAVTDTLRIASVVEANSEEELKALHDEFVQLGFEGLMIRKMSETYKYGRCNNILKYKEFQDEEVDVIGVEEGKGTEKGTAILVVKDERDNSFRVRFRGPFEERTLWLEDTSCVIGKKATIRYQELTPDGVPRFPVGIAIRDYE